MIFFRFHLKNKEGNSRGWTHLSTSIDHLPDVFPGDLIQFHGHVHADDPQCCVSKPDLSKHNNPMPNCIMACALVYLKFKTDKARLLTSYLKPILFYLRKFSNGFSSPSHFQSISCSDQKHRSQICLLFLTHFAYNPLVNIFGSNFKIYI